jgi:hypothetical protein
LTWYILLLTNVLNTLKFSLNGCPKVVAMAAVVDKLHTRGVVLDIDDLVLSILGLGAFLAWTCDVLHAWKT